MNQPQQIHATYTDNVGVCALINDDNNSIHEAIESTQGKKILEN